MNRPILKPVPDATFINHDTNAETRLEALDIDSYLTPNELFFVRNNSATPAIDVTAWRLEVGGDAILHPFTLDYDELLAMPAHTVTCYLECAGNGRSFYGELTDRPGEGTPWKLGAIGIAEWRGVPLAALLARAGVTQSAVDVNVIGLDTPPIERPIPIDVALHPDTLLVTHMNGELLPPDHGFPLRLIVPGWIGMANVKWVGRITVSSERVYVEKNTTDYIMLGPDYPAEPPALGGRLDRQVVKSALMLPWPAILAAGRQTVRGLAWSPNGAIDRVEVSLDGGRTFQAAELFGPNLPQAGTKWSFTWEATPGEMTITPRATDDTGATQPDASEQRWNKLGYLFGAMVPHPVTIVPSSAAG